MSFPVSAVPGDLTSQPSHQPLTKTELDEALRALATPFDLQSSGASPSGVTIGRAG
jgi:hypothetical protein